MWTQARAWRWQAHRKLKRRGRRVPSHSVRAGKQLWLHICAPHQQLGGLPAGCACRAKTFLAADASWRASPGTQIPCMLPARPWRHSVEPCAPSGVHSTLISRKTCGVCTVSAERRLRREASGRRIMRYGFRSTSQLNKRTACRRARFLSLHHRIGCTVSEGTGWKRCAGSLWRSKSCHLHAERCCGRSDTSHAEHVPHPCSRSMPFKPSHTERASFSWRRRFGHGDAHGQRTGDAASG